MYGTLMALIILLMAVMLVIAIGFIKVERKVDALIKAFTDETGVVVNVDKTKFKDFNSASEDPYNKAFDGEPEDRRITV